MTNDPETCPVCDTPLQMWPAEERVPDLATENRSVVMRTKKPWCPNCEEWA